MPKYAKQIAALLYCKTQIGVEIMLVTSRETGRWVIAKGWPMSGKTDYETAAIEAYEEAGVEGRIEKTSCGTYTYDKRKKSGRLLPTKVSVYALKVQNELESWPEKTQRRRQWFTQIEASKLVQETELQNLIATFIP